MGDLADDLEFIDDDGEFNYADALRAPARLNGALGTIRIRLWKYYSSSRSLSAVL